MWIIFISPLDNLLFYAEKRSCRSRRFCRFLDEHEWSHTEITESTERYLTTDRTNDTDFYNENEKFTQKSHKARKRKTTKIARVFISGYCSVFYVLNDRKVKPQIQWAIKSRRFNVFNLYAQFWANKLQSEVCNYFQHTRIITKSFFYPIINQMCILTKASACSDCNYKRKIA